MSVSFPECSTKKLGLFLAMAALPVACATQEMPAAAPVMVETTATNASFCDGKAVTPNDRLWQVIDETTTVTTKMRTIADGTVKYCVSFDIAGDPLTQGGSACADTPEQATAIFAYEFASYLCGVTSE